MQHLSLADAAAEAASAAAARAGALRYNFISCLILAAQNGFGQDVDHLAALCRETWGEEQWWDAVKDLPHGRVVREGPARRGAAVPFGFERGPFSAGRTHVMYAAQAGDVARLTWLLARGARLELKDWAGKKCAVAAGAGRAAGAKGLAGKNCAVLGCAGGARGDGAGAARAGRCGKRFCEWRLHAFVRRQLEGPLGGCS